MKDTWLTWGHTESIQIDSEYHEISNVWDFPKCWATKYTEIEFWFTTEQDLSFEDNPITTYIEKWVLHIPDFLLPKFI